MKLTGKLSVISVDLATGEPTLTLTVKDKNALLECYNDLKGRDVDIELKRHRKKRSLEANSYAWVLIDKLAEHLNLSKTEIYRECIRQIGGVSEIVCLKEVALEKLAAAWSANGLGWQVDTMPSKHKGYVVAILYYGSSTYDTKQMSTLIDILVQDCHAVGIETLTPEEINNMMSLYEQADRR